MAFVELEKARELLFKLRNECIASNVKEDTIRGILYSVNELEKLPTADVAEVKHGAWKEHFAFGCWHYDCPFCDDGYATKEKDKTPPNYCQNCGARMDGRSEV